MDEEQKVKNYISLYSGYLNRIDHLNENQINLLKYDISQVEAERFPEKIWKNNHFVYICPLRIKLLEILATIKKKLDFR
jgi:hypothetical protein